jgi:hypothetical protein
MSKKVATLRVASAKPAKVSPVAPDAARETIVDSIVGSQQMEGVPATHELAREAVEEAFRLPLRPIGS